MCDRNNTDVPTSQIGFLRGFIISSFDCLVSMFPNLKFTIENAENNVKEWQKLQNEKNLLGWADEKKKEEKKNNEEEKKNNDDDKKNNDDDKKNNDEERKNNNDDN